jgi:tetratricopeptide (TPR) repeat protein
MKNLNRFRVISLIALIGTHIINGCTTTLSLADLQNKAEVAYHEGDYATALQHYKKLIEKWNSNHTFEENPYYDKAGHAAFALKQYNMANDYFAHSMHYGTAGVQTYLTLIDYNREINNFSREMTTLKGLIEKFPDVAPETGAHERLFEMYVETGRWQEAAAETKHIGRESDAGLLEQMLMVYNRIGNNEEEANIARQLLEMDSNNIAALEWQAKKYFEAAEARYNAETEAYEHNKSRRQYAQLLKGYEEAGEDYRKARDIFERLYKQNPERRYAIYLYNIYARFQDEEKANYYRARF